MKRNMHGPNPNKRLLLYFFVTVPIFFFLFEKAEAMDALFHTKEKINPDYIATIEFQFARSQNSIPEIILMVPEQIKYEKYPITDIRRLVFHEVVGERNLCPVYTVTVHFRHSGHPREALLMPLREIRGLRHGVQWIYGVDSGRGYEDNAEALEEINFVPPKATLQRTLRRTP